MSVLAECDWVIEGVVERLDIKKSMLSKIAEYARPEVPVTTNTSGLLWLPWLKICLNTSLKIFVLTF